MRLYHFQGKKVARVAKVARYMRLYHFQNIKVAKVAKVAKFQASGFSGSQDCEVWKACKVSDLMTFRISRLRRLLDMNLSFSGCESCEGCKGCKVSDFIIFRISALQVSQGSQDLSLSGYSSCECCKSHKILDCHFQDVKVARVAKVASYQTLLFSGYQGRKGCIHCVGK